MTISRRTIVSVITFASFILVTLVVIFLAQGKRFNLSTNQIYGTGIIAVETNPQGASVSLNGEMRGTSNLNISNLPAETYAVKVEKDGYAPWESTVQVKAGKVVTLTPLMVPINPSLSPITSAATSRPVLSPDGQKLAYGVPSGSSAGIWVLDLSSQPFNLNSKPVQVVADTAVLAYSSATLTWSPNNREILAVFDNGLSSNSYLLAVDKNHPPQDVTANKDELLTGWQDEKQQSLEELVSDLDEEGKQLALDHADTLVWAPTNLKFLYSDEVEGKRVYSTYNKETKTYHEAMTVSLDTFTAVRWYADGQHLIVLEKDSADATTGKVSLMDLDGSNKMQAFAGTLIGDTLYTYLNGAKLVILTSFNQQSDSYYLYSINLR